LWLVRILRFELPESVSSSVCEMDDPFVALLMLDLREQRLATSVAESKWASFMNAESLYSEHWMLAYEAARRGWISGIDVDYIEDDLFFGLEWCFILLSSV
jgi:hypothetical protein